MSARITTCLLLALAAVLVQAAFVGAAWAGEARGTGDLGLVIERAAGSARILETTGNRLLGRVTGLGDLSHASVVYSRDQRHAFVFGRDGGLSRVDMLTGEVVARVMQSGNSIGGAISQDGSLVAVSNYEPGGVRVFDSTTLEPVAEIPADYGGGARSKVVGLVDAPGNRFVFSLWDAGEIWIADFSSGELELQRFGNVGRNPYDALITPDGRYYVAGLFGEDGLAVLDLWHPERGVKRVLDHYGAGDEKLPVYKMPHLEGWAIAGRHAFVPAVGAHRVLVIDTESWQETARIEVLGQPVFVMAEPGGRRVWVNFALPDNGSVQVIDTESLAVADTLEPGPGVLHLEFEPRGEEVWLSVRDRNEVHVVDTATLATVGVLEADAPSGIFFTARAHRTGL